MLVQEQQAATGEAAVGMGSTEVLATALDKGFVTKLLQWCCVYLLQAIDLKDCDVYSYKSDGETDPFGESKV